MKKGRKLSEEHKRKIGEANLGKKRPPFSVEQKYKIGVGWRGKKRPPFSEEWKKNISKSCRGEKAWNWKGGISKYPSYGLENLRKWRKKNPDKAILQNQRRRARKRNAEGYFTLSEWQTLKAQYNWTCQICKKSEPEIKLTIDHIIPLSRGGSNNIENIQPLCKSCNSKKWIKIII